MFDLLTNPYLLGYTVLIALLFRAGLALRRMHEQNVERRKAKLESDTPQTPALKEGQVASMANAQSATSANGVLPLSASQSSAEHRAGVTLPYLVRAEWDAARQLWVARSREIRDLVAEARTVEALGATLLDMVPELLVASGCMPASGEVAIELVAHRVLIAPPSQA